MPKQECPICHRSLRGSESVPMSALNSNLRKSILRQNPDVAVDPTPPNSPLTIGQRVADRVAAFGGSWTFIFTFSGVLVVWITVNVVAATLRFDPYPFILLNLVLSGIAALQAPIIMVSQNRQEEKDRERARNDYRVNLKAELEVRALPNKIDHLRSQMHTLMEFPEAQPEMRQRLARLTGNP